MMWKSGAVDCTHPVDSIPPEAHHSHGRYAYYVYQWRSDLHYHDVLSDQDGPLVVSQTNQFLLGSNDMLFKNQYKHYQSVVSI